MIHFENVNHLEKFNFLPVSSNNLIFNFNFSFFVDSIFTLERRFLVCASQSLWDEKKWNCRSAWHQQHRKENTHRNYFQCSNHLHNLTKLSNFSFSILTSEASKMKPQLVMKFPVFLLHFHFRHQLFLPWKSHLSYASSTRFRHWKSFHI